MSHACSIPDAPAADPRYRRILWVALVSNAAMFAIEVGASWSASSLSLLADSIDFFGDAANYAVSLAVLDMALRTRARASLLKAACMAGFGVYVLGRAVWDWRAGGVPEPVTMGVVGTMALAVNAGVAWLLYRYRTGDSNMRSVWICTRNDALGNVAVLLAALGVFGTASAWPDLVVASAMALLALTGAIAVARQARAELRGEGGAPAAAGHHHHHH